LMLLCCTGTRHATIADHGLIVRQAILAAVPIDDPGPLELYVGDANGVDLIVRQFARLAVIKLHEFEANWDECAANCNTGHRRPYKHGRGDYCPQAGVRRNHTMLRAYAEAGGRLVLPFPAANARSSGTNGCVAAAKRAGLDVAEPIPLTVQVSAR